MPARLWDINKKAGNWPWGRPAIPSPSGTKPYFIKPTPIGSGWVDWSHEGNQWLRSQDFRARYVDNYRNAWSTESYFATLSQLVPGFHHETITKGRVLQQENRADGMHNPNGVNLYEYVERS